MTKKLLIAIAGLSVVLGLTSVACANTISIAFQETGVNGGAITTEATGSGTASFMGLYGNFVADVTGTGTPASPQPDLDSNPLLALNFSGLPGATLTIYVTETGITSPIGLTDLLSSFSLPLIAGAGTSVVETTEYSNSNALYSGTPLASQTFTPIGPPPSSTSTKVTTSSPFSETEVYVITTTGFGTGAGGDISIGRIPEPATLSLLGTGLLGLGLLGLRKKVYP